MLFEVAGLCFTSGPGLSFSHDPWLVALSLVMAAFGSYTALDMTERQQNATGEAVWLWHCCAALALGGGIWAMHFIGMLASTLGVPVAYEPVRTVLSLVTAVGFVSLGLLMVNGGDRSLVRLGGAGVIVGLGVAAMHYLGMSALVVPGTVAYRPLPWALSVLIAIFAATAALWLSTRRQRLRERVAAALVMAVAIGGMHYAGMGAAVVTLDPLASSGQGIGSVPLAIIVTLGVFGVLMLAEVSVIADRRLSAAAIRESAALKLANIELEAARLQLEATQREIIRRLCSAGECRDDETAQHVVRMARMAHRLAERAGCGEDFADRLQEAAPLHDIGKIGVPDHVLLKPARLTPEEWVVMQGHARIGQRLLAGSGLPLLDLAAEIAGTHHEKWDGTGYPLGLQGEAIPLSGRIVAIADVFDALLSRRPYKQPWPLDQAVALLREQSGRHFDPRLVEVFLDDLPAVLAIRASLMDEDKPAGPDGTPHASMAI